MSDKAIRVQELIKFKKFGELKKLFNEIHPIDIKEILDQIDYPDRLLAFLALPKDLAAEVFTEMDIDDQTHILKELGDKKTAHLLDEMGPDDRTELFQELPANVVKKLITLLEPDERQLAIKLLAYSKDSVGRLMTPEFVDLKSYMTVKEALNRIKRIAPDKETIYYCYITDSTRRLIGITTLRDLLISQPDVVVGEIMHEDVKHIKAEDDQEIAAELAKKYGLIALPVVDSEDRLVGIVTIDDLMDVMETEATEDITRMSAIHPLERSYLDTDFFTMVRSRIVWLFILLITATITSHIIANFSSAIESVVALSFFIPLLMSAGGNTGSQSATLIIRGMATGEISDSKIFHVLSKELAIGCAIGLLMALAASVWAYYIGNRDIRISIIVGLTLIVTVFLANLIGAILPIISKAINIDPAIMAGPFIGTLVDVTTLLIYFTIAIKIMNL